jgi:hypothetical protein
MGRSIDLAKKPKHKAVSVTMDLKDAIDLIHWARRYCDGRSTPAPSSFNQILKRVRAENESLIMHDTFDQTLKSGGLHWPFAQDGMYDAQSGVYDATK